MPVTISLPRGKPKSAILDLAFDDCGMNGYASDRTPEEQTNALRKLNAMMLEQPWAQLGYRQPTYGVGLPEEVSGIPDFALSTVAMYLAVRIAPGLGASLAPEQTKAMARSLLTMQAELATLPCTHLPGNTVRGSGRGAFGGFRNRPYTGAALNARFGATETSIAVMNQHVLNATQSVLPSAPVDTTLAAWTDANGDAWTDASGEPYTE